MENETVTNVPAPEPDNGTNPHKPGPRTQQGEKLAAHEFRAKVAELTRARKSIREIARTLGCGRTRVHRTQRKLFEYWHSKYSEDIAAARALDVNTIDAAIRSIMPKVELGELDAIDRLEKLLRRRATTLGYDMPKRISLEGEVGKAVSYLSMAAAVMQTGTLPTPPPLDAAPDAGPVPPPVEPQPGEDDQAAAP